MNSIGSVIIFHLLMGNCRKRDFPQVSVHIALNYFEFSDVKQEDTFLRFTYLSVCNGTTVDLY